MEHIKTGAQFALLDVRTLTEHRAMRFKGSRHIPLDELESRLSELDVIDNSKETLIVYCRSGARSATAVDLLLSRGRTNVLNLSGGILAFCREYGEDQLESDASGGFS
jgi:rhodanese-related sulfurtransferase